MAAMLILASVLLDKARFLQLDNILVNDATVLTHLVIHPLKVLWQQTRWT